MKKKKVVIILGPTASGKTSLSIEMAKSIQSAEVVNFDSLLFYRGMNIGTAKPSTEEQDGVIHHLIDIETPNSPLSAADYIKKAMPVIDRIHQQDGVPILVGGSAFYIRALVKGMYGSDEDRTDQKIIDELDQLYNENGISPFLEYLDQYDPESRKQLHENDHYRVRRAVEFHRQNGTPISERKAESDKNLPYDFSINQHPDWDMTILYLLPPKEQHWEIMEKRAKEMIEAGLVEEVKELIEAGYGIDDKPLQSIGYKETFDFIKGQFDSEEDYLERIYLNTRRLAKSQKTFFKKVTPKETLDPLSLDYKERVAEIISSIQNS